MAPSVIVIGAGASGLAAACRLVKRKLENVLVLEASDRIGGRVHSVNCQYKSLNIKPEELSHTIELGAQWVHGKHGNVCYELGSFNHLLEENGADREMTAEELKDTWFVSDSDGVVVDIDKVLSFIETVYSKVETFQHPASESHGSFFNKIFDEITEKEGDEFRKGARIFKDFYHRLIRNIDGCTNWHGASFEGSLVRYIECPGRGRIAFRSEHKYLDVLESIARDIPEKCLRLNSEVTQVQRGSPLRVFVKGRDEPFEADFVIVTVSLGVLKLDAETLFRPPLPVSKLEAINLLEMGVVNKIFLEFDNPWWDTARTKLGFGFLFSDIAENDEFAFSNQDAEKDWTRFLLGAYLVENRPRLLCFWLSGEGAKKMETLLDSQIKDDCMRTLRKFLKNIYPSLPEPVSIRVSRWHSNPFTRGSYSYQSPDSELGRVTPDTLAEPVDGNLFFAGEATHLRFFSTVHGAIETGWREADRVLKTI